MCRQPGRGGGRCFDVCPPPPLYCQSHGVPPAKKPLSLHALACSCKAVFGFSGARKPAGRVILASGHATEVEIGKIIQVMTLICGVKFWLVLPGMSYRLLCSVLLAAAVYLSVADPCLCVLCTCRCAGRHRNVSTVGCTLAYSLHLLACSKNAGQQRPDQTEREGRR